MRLTVKQEKFALKYAECGNASEAYRYAYNAENMKASTINEKACLTLKADKVRARVDELKLLSKSVAEEKFTISVKQRLEWAKQIVEAGLSTYEDQSGSKYHNLSAANQAIATLNTMLGVDEESGKAKPVKVFVGVKDASRP